MTETKYSLLNMDEVSKGITYNPANVVFHHYDDYMNQAREIANYINGIELTEDNIREVKATLAAARKVTDGLDRKRIDMKKFLLGNFTDFEIQIKGLQVAISNAENVLRSKVRNMEEKEREEKKKDLAEIWDKRFPSYTLSKLADSYPVFVRWLQPSYLNKSVSLKSVEKSMVEWLEKTESDITACQAMGDEYLAEYLTWYDLPTAISNVRNRQEKAVKIAEMRADDEDATEGKEAEITALFAVSGTAFIALTERLLTENKIPFTKR